MMQQPRRRFPSSSTKRRSCGRSRAAVRLGAAAFLLAAGLAACVSSQQAAPTAPTSAASPPATSGGADEATGIDNLNAVLWVQTSVEYRATAQQAYELGRRVLDEALADPTWTAFPDPEDGYEDLPPAVILDIDETVLDNSPYEARLLLDGEAYDESSWADWVEQRVAEPIPGARQFVEYAEERGVTVFYVSNRRAPLEAATRANLAVEGFSLDSELDTVLLRGEVPEWEASDKSPRWQQVASAYRVLLMFGDNMGDFTEASSGSVAERAALALQHAEYWGTRWITLANPTYGSFIGAVLDNDFSLPYPQQVERKKRALDPRR